MSNPIDSKLQEDIARIRKMATDDPENELGHFRLGKLLLEAEQFPEAAASFRRTLELNPEFSKVFHLLAISLVRMNQKAAAIKTLRDGIAVADERGDNVPREDMAKMLVELGETAPAPIKASASKTGGGFRCQRPGCPAGAHARQLPKPPMSDEIGQKIYAQVCADCWNYWLRDVSIKVINEMRLDLSTEQGVGIYDQIMSETLGLS